MMLNLERKLKGSVLPHLNPALQQFNINSGDKSGTFVNCYQQGSKQSTFLFHSETAIIS